MLIHSILFLISLIIVIQTSELAVANATELAQRLRWNEYIVGFLIVAVISVFPEALISIMAALHGVPTLGLGTLFGSNVADLTLTFAIVVLASGKNLKVSSSILKADHWYLGLLALPVVLGLDGAYSQVDGLLLIIVGIYYYYTLLRHHRLKEANTAPALEQPAKRFAAPLIIFLFSIVLLLIGSSLTVAYGESLAADWEVPATLIGLIVVGIGTTMPELFFSLRSARHDHDRLALGDILGNVMTDATMVLGAVALVHPFSFDRGPILLTGLFMLLSAVLLFSFLRSDKLLTKNESLALVVFYVFFVVVELFIGR